MVKPDYQTLRQEIRKIMITNETKRRELAGLENEDDDTMQATTMEPGEAPTTAASVKRAAMYDGLADDEEEDDNEDDEEAGEKVVATATTTVNLIHQTVDEELAKFDKVLALPIHWTGGRKMLEDLSCWRHWLLYILRFLRHRHLLNEFGVEPQES